MMDTTLADRVEFALRDAGWGLDEAAEISGVLAQHDANEKVLETKCMDLLDAKSLLRIQLSQSEVRHNRMVAKLRELAWTLSASTCRAISRIIDAEAYTDPDVRTPMTLDAEEPAATKTLGDFVRMPDAERAVIGLEVAQQVDDTMQQKAAEMCRLRTECDAHRAHQAAMIAKLRKLTRMW